MYIVGEGSKIIMKKQESRHRAPTEKFGGTVDHTKKQLCNSEELKEQGLSRILVLLDLSTVSIKSASIFVL